jgi:type IV secretory pathway VirB3-like protein
MLPSVLSVLTTGEWIVAVGSGLVLLLSVMPVVWLCWHFVQMSDTEMANTIADVERFAASRDSARKAMWQ